MAKVPSPEGCARTQHEPRRSDLLQMMNKIAASMLECAAVGEAERGNTNAIERLDAGGGIAVFIAPASPLNRAIGMGSRGVVAEEEVIEVENFFRSRRALIRIALSERAHPSLSHILERRGYTRGLPMQNWYLRVRDRVPALAADVEVEPADRDRADVWANIVGTGFQELNSPETAIDANVAALFKTLGFASDSRPYFALRKGQIAGGAVLSVCGDVGFLRTASSRWAHRAHGVQSALITARLRDAEKLGCSVVFSSTQCCRISERNLIRNGFRRLSRSYMMEKQIA